MMVRELDPVSLIADMYTEWKQLKNFHKEEQVLFVYIEWQIIILKINVYHSFVQTSICGIFLILITHEPIESRYFDLYSTLL